MPVAYTIMVVLIIEKTNNRTTCMYIVIRGDQSSDIYFCLYPLPMELGKAK